MGNLDNYFPQVSQEEGKEAKSRVQLQTRAEYQTQSNDTVETKIDESKFTQEQKMIKQAKSVVDLSNRFSKNYQQARAEALSTSDKDSRNDFFGKGVPRKHIVRYYRDQ